jgi:hypothetical protein
VFQARVSLCGERPAGYDLWASPESVYQSVHRDSVRKQQGSIAVEIDRIGELMLKGSDRLRGNAGTTKRSDDGILRT